MAATILKFPDFVTKSQSGTIQLSFTFYSLAGPMPPANRFSLPAFRPRLPIHSGLIVDGRTSRQFVASVREYLTWRSGRSWLPVARRFHPESLYYAEGLNTLNSAFKSGLLVSGDDCACCYCVTGAPFADERKPVASVGIDGAARRATA